MKSTREHLDKIEYLEQKIKAIEPPTSDNVSIAIRDTEDEVIAAVIDHITFSKQICIAMEGACKNEKEVDSKELIIVMKTVNDCARKWILFLALNRRLEKYRDTIMEVKTEMDLFLTKILKKIIFVFPLPYCKNSGPETFH